ncbi:MAG: glycosyltransferase [Chromatiales bacterium]|nr:glycosyltransferase [Chromatiales bacterium]
MSDDAPQAVRPPPSPTTPDTAGWDTDLDEALTLCRVRDLLPVVIAADRPPPPSVVEAWLERTPVAGVVVPDSAPPDSVDGDPRLGRWQPSAGSWELPEPRARAVLLLGGRPMVSFRMCRTFAARGGKALVYFSLGRWQVEKTETFLARRVAEKAGAVLERSTVRLAAATQARVARVLGPGAGRTLFDVTQALQRATTDLAVRPALVDALDIARRWRRAPYRPHPGRVLMVNASLAWGGAERQLVNTVTGLRRRGHDDVAIVCERLHDSADHDFYLDRLSRERVEVARVRAFPSAAGEVFDAAGLHAAVTRLPRAIADDVCRYTAEIGERRPEVVHAWQDSPNVTAGLAALLVGVPRIVLSMRNMAPFRFAYHQPYMRPAYRFLAGHDNVVMVNNSAPGAADYASWLGLPSGRIRVLRNGHVIEGEAPEPSAVARYRDALGIPREATVLGSVFRFYPEKDPLLWLESAARVARRRPEVWLLMIGTGPLQGAMRERARALGVEERLVLPGTEQRTRLALAAMDLFLLTSHLEGTPNVVLEAQAAGLPVVATEAGGTADAVEPGVTGWIAADRAPATIAERIDAVLDDPAWRARARARGPAFVAECFSMERMVDETMALYGWGAEDGARAG